MTRTETLLRPKSLVILKYNVLEQILRPRDPLVGAGHPAPLFTRLYYYFLPLFFPFPFAGVALVAEGATAVLEPVAVDCVLSDTGSVLAESGFPPR